MKIKQLLLTTLLIAGTITTSVYGAVLPAPKSTLQVGVLSCSVQGGWGLVLGSSKNAQCTFTDASGKITKYGANIGKIGIDVGYTGAKTIVWVVIAPSNITPKNLVGSYVGANAEAALGFGVGVNALVGGGANSVALNPISVQGQVGVSVTLAAQSLNLY